MKKFILAIPFGIPSLIMLAVVAYLSLAPDPVPVDDFELFPGADKLAHVLLYFWAACVFILDYAKWRLPHHVKLENLLAFTAFTIVLGAVMETGQLVMRLGRSFELWDMLADALGAIGAFVFIKYWYMHKFRKTFYYSLRKRRSTPEHSKKYVNEKRLKAKVAERQEELKARIEAMAREEEKQ